MTPLCLDQTVARRTRQTNGPHASLGLFRLPGDLEFGDRNWKVYFPVGTCILISVILTVILWVIHHFRR